MPKRYRYRSIDEVLPHCYRSFSLPFMMCDCSSALRMLTTLQHQTTYRVYFRMIMNLAVVGSVLVCIHVAPSASAQSCTLPTCFVNGSDEILCSSCPVGYGVEVKDFELMLCSNSPPRNTKCEPCIAGVNFSDTNDLEKQCSDCLSCHGTKEVVTKECTPESDRECMCKEGLYYYKDGLNTCVPCTICGEGYEETRPCTPTVNRECGPMSVPPVTTTPVHPTTNQTISTVGTSPSDTEMSTKPETSGKHLSAGEIAVIVIVLIVLIVLIIIIACKVRYRGGFKCTRDICTGGEGGIESPMIFNCCIGVQTNKYNSHPIPTVSMQGVNGLNGTQYHGVPNGSEDQPDGAVCGQPNGVVARQPNGDVGRQPNGVVARQPNGVVARQQSATSPTTEETEHQQSVEDALDFSAERRERLIKSLEDDVLSRNAHLLASKHFSHSTCNLLASSNTPASDVLNMWVQQGKTKADLTRALREMERDDVADICEEDS